MHKGCQYCYNTFTICKQSYITNVPLQKSSNQFLYKSFTKTLALYNINSINKQYSSPYEAIIYDYIRTVHKEALKHKGRIPESKNALCVLQFIQQNPRFKHEMFSFPKAVFVSSKGHQVEGFINKCFEMECSGMVKEYYSIRISSNVWRSQLYSKECSALQS